jgi:hypothetical protein
MQNTLHTAAQTNPGSRKAKLAPKRTYWCTQAVLTPGVGSWWGTMAKVSGRPYTVVAVAYNAKGVAQAYQVRTQAGLVANLPANLVGPTYTGWASPTGMWPWGTCKLAASLGITLGTSTIRAL